MSDKYYIAIWSVSEDLKRGNKNSIHNFIYGDGEKCTIASKLHRVDVETVKKIRQLLESAKESEIE
jgi:hypothetical protein